MPSTISALQVARAAYKPKLPPALKKGAAVKVQEGAATQSVADQDKIKRRTQKNGKHFYGGNCKSKRTP